MLTSNTPIRKTKGTATMVVAPSGATAAQKAMADYKCSGADDEVQINAAIVAAAAAGGRESGSVGVGGEVYLLAGNYSISAPIVILTRVSLIGQGNLQSVRISSASNSGHGIYFIARGAASSPISAIERGQFMLKNICLIISLTQSATSWAIYIEHDGTEGTYDAVFDNVYVSRAKDGGMYLGGAWAAHFKDCTFEGVSAGVGLHEVDSTHSTHIGTFCAHNQGHGLLLEATSSKKYFNSYFGCGFDDNGDGSNNSSGVYINSVYRKEISFFGCWARNNFGSGFYVNAGEQIVFNGCTAFYNNWSEAWENAGFKCGTLGKYITFVNCFSSYNDGVNAAIEDHDGAGYYMSSGDYNKLLNCKSNYNEYGVVANSGVTQFDCDVKFLGQDTNNWRFMGAKKQSIGRTCVDSLSNVAAVSTNGIKAAIINTTPVTSMDGQMGFPRNITVTGDAAADGVVKIEGITADGKVLDTTLCDEEITVSAGATVQGNIAWAKITKITRTTVNGSVDVGWGDKLGLSNMIRATSDVYKLIKNGAHLNTPTVNADYATVDCSTINANDDFVIYYKGF